jgi:hypothetical protein
MNSIIMPETVQLNEEIIEQLSLEVMETSVIETNVNNNKKKFTAADMWNRHKNSRSASSMLRRWDLN